MMVSTILKPETANLETSIYRPISKSEKIDTFYAKNDEN